MAKRNPPDATTRNVRASNRRDQALASEIESLRSAVLTLTTRTDDQRTLIGEYATLIKDLARELETIKERLARMERALREAAARENPTGGSPS